MCIYAQYNKNIMITSLILNISKSPKTSYNHSKFHESIINKVAKIKGGVFLWQRELNKAWCDWQSIPPHKDPGWVGSGFPKTPREHSLSSSIKAEIIYQKSLSTKV